MENHVIVSTSCGKLHSHKELQLQKHITQQHFSLSLLHNMEGYIKKEVCLPGPSMSAKIVEKSSSFTTTLMPSGGVSSRFFNSLASCLITLGGRFSLVA